MKYEVNERIKVINAGWAYSGEMVKSYLDGAYKHFYSRMDDIIDGINSDFYNNHEGIVLAIVNNHYLIMVLGTAMFIDDDAICKMR